MSSPSATPSNASQILVDVTKAFTIDQLAFVKSYSELIETEDDNYWIINWVGDYNDHGLKLRLSTDLSVWGWLTFNNCALIMINHRDLNQVGREMMVIDGQQRTTSTMLFLASTRHQYDDDGGCDRGDDDSGGAAQCCVISVIWTRWTEIPKEPFSELVTASCL